MKKETLKLSLRIILLGIVAMASSYIPELYPNIFGDWHCEGSISIATEKPFSYTGCNYGTDFHHSTWHWGYRHYLYLLMCIILLIVQIKDIIEDK